ncbi:hypothetical protein [Wenxinia marina]|uniref:Glycerophosphoryl diester phosphodiesterase membrane domain-containing protein n=1 Tax=Wenxinia marina DSM 24838 TaxID=1123501 RepID=A0A0D0QJ05_9RHOB|nr:hypothetical protein [Wenxinia marina]KIQ71038.1 hypothetical protein Wenmar_00416 [Wenxinia marina DSM 24838]GGL55379.1 hypothetical protein GCM10011392_07180 [Wenxinia marina]
MGWRIVRHSIVLLFRNFGAALAVSIGPLAIALIGIILAGLALGFSPAGALVAPYSFYAMATLPTDSDPEAAAMMMRVGILLFVHLAVILLVSAWIAVAWHRYVLVEEAPGLVPPVRGGTILGYAGRTILLGLLVVLAAIPLSMVLGLVAAPALQRPDSLVSQIVVFALSVVIPAVLSWMWLRLGLVLPARAVGQAFGLGDSWRATQPAAGPIFAAALLLGLIALGLSLVVPAVFGSGWPGLALQLAANWFSLMLGISILTALYGHLVEGRDFPA